MIFRIRDVAFFFLAGICIGIGGTLCSNQSDMPHSIMLNQECSFNAALNASWVIEQKQIQLDMQRIKYLGGPDNFLKWLNMRNERAAIEGAKE